MTDLTINILPYDCINVNYIVRRKKVSKKGKFFGENSVYIYEGAGKPPATDAEKTRSPPSAAFNLPRRHGIRAAVCFFYSTFSLIAGSHLKRVGDTMSPSFLSKARARSTTFRSSPVSSAILPAFSGCPAALIV